MHKLALLLHVVASVAWIGAVAAFLAVAVAGQSGVDPDVVRGAFVAAELIGRTVIVPLSVAALCSGVVLSLGTRWGLFRHTWVVLKLVLTVGAVALLLLHQFTAVAAAARRAAEAAPGTMPDLGGLDTQLVADAALAIVGLLVITTLAVFKPWGMTAFGRRAELPAAGDGTPRAVGLPSGLKVFLGVLAALLVAVAVGHATGHGLGHHGP